MKTDTQLRQDVLAELEWERSIKTNGVAVFVNEGVVLLNGQLETWGEKRVVERAVQRVTGVKAIAVELAIRLPHHRRGNAKLRQPPEQASNKMH